MSDDSPKVDGRGKSPGSLGALRPATSETAGKLNPKGTNGWDARRKMLIEFLNCKSADPEKTRIEKVMLATYTNSLTPKGAMDRRILFEYYAGQAVKAIDGLSLAEHFRHVERDKVQLALAILGPRIQGMDPVKLAEFFQVCAANPLGFMAEAERFLRGEGVEQEPQTVEALPAVPPEELPK